jgi:hypothetical protein
VAQKFKTIQSGRDALKEATVISGGIANAGDIPALDSAGKLDITVLPTGVGPDTKVLEATENLTAGKYVNIFNDAGTEKCRLADASNDRPAHGFVKDLFNIGQSAIIYFEGANDDLSALTPGARQYLSTAGSATPTPRTAAGLHQFLGIAISATEINTDIDDETVIL